MVISETYPPNIKDIARVIPDVLSYKNAVFTYGDTIHNPGNHVIDECVSLHEATHSLQQDKEGGAKRWWKRWISEPKFRTEQELEGYGHQYRRFCELNRDRNQRAGYLMHISSDLASKQYGGVISLTEARKRIALYAK